MASGKINLPFINRPKSSGQISIAAGATTGIICVPDSISGYQCIGAVRVTNGGNDYVSILSIGNDGVKLRNDGTSTQYPVIGVEYLYKYVGGGYKVLTSLISQSFVAHHERWCAA